MVAVHEGVESLVCNCSQATGRRNFWAHTVPPIPERVLYYEQLVPFWIYIGAGGPVTASCLGAGIRWGALVLFKACRGKEGAR